MIGTILIADGLHQSLAKPLPVWVFYTWPPLTFYRALFLINEAANSPELQPYVYSDMVAGNDLYNCLLVMYAQTTICFALAGYLTYVLPSEFGVRRSWYYALTRLWRQIMGYRRRKHVSRLFTVTDMEGYLIRNRDAEDDLVCKERNRIVIFCCRYAQHELTLE